MSAASSCAGSAGCAGSCAPSTGRPTPDPGLRRAVKPRRTTGPVLPGLLISGILAGLVMLHDPGMTGYRFRQLVDHLSGKGGGSYAFVVNTTDGDPVGWDHCKPIRYVVNPAGAPDEWEDIIRGGVREITDASGFEFQYDGTSVDRSFTKRVADADDPPPVLVAWASSDEVPDLAGSTAGHRRQHAGARWRPRPVRHRHGGARHRRLRPDGAAGRRARPRS